MAENEGWEAVAAIAAAQHGCFSHQQAMQHGIGRRRLDRAVSDGLVARPRPRVLRFAGVRVDWRCVLATAVLSSGGVASHRSAARLHGLDGFDRGPIEVTVPRGRMPSLDDVIVHRWAAPDTEQDHDVIDGIPCTSVAATLAQLGAVSTQARVEQALDDALRRGAPMRWIQDTAERLHRPGPSGTATLLRILADERRSGRLPDSWFERVVQRILDAADIPPPVVQHEVISPSGARFRLDLAWPSLALGLECHSRRYHFGPLKEASDHQRDLELASAGWEVLYMTWAHRRDPSDFLPLLARTLTTRAHQLQARPA